MKNIFKLMAMLALVCCLSSCSDDDEPVVPTLDVTPANLNGTWQLAEWNGQPLAEYITGSFDIEEDPYLGSVISGEYDYWMGDWNSEYIVTDLLESGSMIWTAKDNESDVTKYVRCDKVPDEVVAEARVTE